MDGLGILPQLASPLDQMTQGDLRSLVPQLIHCTTGQKANYKLQNMPVWWPRKHTFNSPRKVATSKQLTRTEVLRDIVQSCYKYHNLEHTLVGPSVRHPPTSPQLANNGKKMSPLHLALAQPPIAKATMDRLLPYDHRNMLMLAQEPEDLEARIPVPEQTATGSVSGISPSLPPGADIHGKETKRKLVDVYVCFFCETEFDNMEELTGHRPNCKKQPADPKTPIRPSVFDCTNSMSTPKVKFNRQVSVNKSSFTMGLGLHPLSKKRSLRIDTRKQIQFGKIDVDRDLPRSPTTPRTPKSLISQLSRMSEEAKDSGSEADSDCGKSDSFDDSSRSRMNRLLAIDVSSVLGQKLIPHLSDVIEEHEVSARDYESYCKTPRKNHALERLRARPTIPKVSFRPRRGHYSYHIYKFNKKQTKEFMKRMNTGLNKKSRKLVREMKTLSVNLKRIGCKDIVRWKVRFGRNKKLKELFVKTTKEEAKPSIFPSLPVLRESEGTLRNLLGLRTNTAPRRSSRTSKQNELVLSQVVSEDVLAEVTKQQVVVYKSVLSELTECLSRAVSASSSSEMQDKLKQMSHVLSSVQPEELNSEPVTSLAPDIHRVNAPEEKRSGKRKRASSISMEQLVASLETPKSKRRKFEWPTTNGKPDYTGQFTCSICGFELTLDNDVEEAVAEHFQIKHEIKDIVLKKDGHASLVIMRSPYQKSCSKRVTSQGSNELSLSEDTIRTGFHSDQDDPEDDYGDSEIQFKNTNIIFGNTAALPSNSSDIGVIPLRRRSLRGMSETRKDITMDRRLGKTPDSSSTSDDQMHDKEVGNLNCADTKMSQNSKKMDNKEMTSVPSEKELLPAPVICTRIRSPGKSVPSITLFTGSRRKASETGDDSGQSCQVSSFPRRASLRMSSQIR